MEARTSGADAALKDSGAPFTWHLSPQGPRCPLEGWPHLVQVRGRVPVVEGREEVEGGFTGAVRREETVTGEEGRDGATTGEVVAGVAVGEGVSGAGGAAEGAGDAALAAWKQAARIRLFTLCAGPRWRGLHEGVEGGGWKGLAGDLEEGGKGGWGGREQS